VSVQTLVRDCLNQKSFRLIDLKTSGDAVTAVFRYGGIDQIILNGVVIAPNTVAQCHTFYGGGSQTDLGKIAGTKLKPNETFTLICTRKANTVATSQRHYEGGIIGVSTNSDSPMLPVIEYYDPVISTKAADACSADIAKTKEAIGTINQRIDSVSLECKEVNVGNNSQDATCPSGYVATGCSAGKNFGSHTILNSESSYMSY
jgi:Resistin